MTESALRCSLRISSASFGSVACDYVAREVLSSSSRWRQSRKISAGLLSLSSDHHPQRRPASRSQAQFSTSQDKQIAGDRFKTCGQSPRVHNRRLLQQNRHKADIETAPSNVRFWGESGHRSRKRFSYLLLGRRRFCDDVTSRRFAHLVSDGLPLI